MLQPQSLKSFRSKLEAEVASESAELCANQYFSAADIRRYAAERHLLCRFNKKAARAHFNV